MEQCYCKQLIGTSIDLITPRNEILTAFYKRSFAYYTVKERLPVILTQVIDGLVRDKEMIGESYSAEGIYDLKKVVASISQLKYEIQTNKPLVELSSQAPDAKHYNSYLKGHLDLNAACQYFNTKWLFVECYMYRRIREAFEATSVLHEYDPFRSKKEQAFTSVLPLITLLGTKLQSILSDEERNVKEDFILLLKLNLWGNKCDLSFSNGQDVAVATDLLDQIAEMNSFILSDDSEHIWAAVEKEHRFQLIDIVLDNAGYELFTDLCLADFIVTKGYAQRMRFYVKTMPWFVSDTMKTDFIWMLQTLKEMEDPILQEIGDRWTMYVENGTWIIEEHFFWTSHFEFKYMFEIDETLYRRLAKAKIVFFKGDLNYRKLFGERNWDPASSVEACLEGFYPTKLCTLRTLKSDIIVGLGEGVAAEAETKDKDWMVNGNFGVIQYSGKVVRLL